MQSTFRTKTLPTMEHTQARRRVLKHGRYADLVSQSHFTGYDSSRYLVASLL